MKTMLSILAALAISAGVTSSSADASNGDDHENGAVAGIVVDENGVPVADATVVLRRRGSDRARRTGHCDGRALIEMFQVHEELLSRAVTCPVSPPLPVSEDDRPTQLN